MVNLEVRCPSCSKRGKIEVSEEKVKNTARGLYAINVSESIICEHSFVVYVDKNLSVRDSFIADFQIDLPTSDSKQEIEEDTTILSETIDVALLQMNFTASLFAFLLKAITRKKEIIIISEKEFLYKHLSNFIKFICHDSFNVKYEIMPLNDYDAIHHGNHVVIQGSEVMKDDDNIFASKQIKVERSIIQTFLNENDPMEGMILLKNELKRIYQLSETIIDMVKNLKKNEKLYSKNIIKDIDNILGVKLQVPYLDYLFEVVEYYFEIEIPRSSSISNFLGTL
ncbi:MAG: hypothetical protein ACTSV5_01675 [Promethearchaeota archaeon]